MGYEILKITTMVLIVLTFSVLVTFVCVKCTDFAIFVRKRKKQRQRERRKQRLEMLKQNQ